MVDLKQAYQIAYAYYDSRGHQEITSLFDAEQDWIWVAFGGKKGEVKVGGAGIAINRETGETEPFYLPSDKNFEILDRAVKIKEEQYPVLQKKQEKMEMAEEEVLKEQNAVPVKDMASAEQKGDEETSNIEDDSPKAAAEEESEGSGKTSGVIDQLTFHQILEAVEKLNQAFDQKVKVDKGKDEMIKTLKDEVAAYQKGNMTKVIDTMSLDIIQLADGIRKTAAVYEKREYSEENYKKLLRVVKGMYQDLQDVLYREGIEPYSIEGHEVDARRQTIIASVPTDDEKRNNLIAARAGEGYAREDGSVLRRERVKIFRYEKKEKQ